MGIQYPTLRRAFFLLFAFFGLLVHATEAGNGGTGKHGRNVLQTSSDSSSNPATPGDASQGFVNRGIVDDVQMSWIYVLIGAIIGAFSLLIGFIFLTYWIISRCCTCCCKGSSCYYWCCEKRSRKKKRGSYKIDEDRVWFMLGTLLVLCAALGGGGALTIAGGVITNKAIDASNSAIATVDDALGRVKNNAQASTVPNRPNDFEGPFRSNIVGLTSSTSERFHNFKVLLDNNNVFYYTNITAIIIYYVLGGLAILAFLIGLVSVIFRRRLLLRLTLFVVLLFQPLYWVLFGLHFGAESGTEKILCKFPEHFTTEVYAQTGFYPAKMLSDCVQSGSWTPAQFYFAEQPTQQMNVDDMTTFIASYNDPQRSTLNLTMSTPQSYNQLLSGGLTVFSNELAGVREFRDGVGDLIRKWLPGPTRKWGDPILGALDDGITQLQLFYDNLTMSYQQNLDYCASSNLKSFPPDLVDWSALNFEDIVISDVYSSRRFKKIIKCLEPMQPRLRIFRNGYMGDTQGARVTKAMANLAAAKTARDTKQIAAAARGLSGTLRLMNTLYAFEFANFTTTMNYLSYVIGSQGSFTCDKAQTLYTISTKNLCTDAKQGFFFAGIGYLIVAGASFLLMILGPLALRWVIFKDDVPRDLNDKGMPGVFRAGRRNTKDMIYEEFMSRERPDYITRAGDRSEAGGPKDDGEVVEERVVVPISLNGNPPDLTEPSAVHNNETTLSGFTMMDERTEGDISRGRILSDASMRSARSARSVRSSRFATAVPSEEPDARVSFMAAPDVSMRSARSAGGISRLDPRTASLRQAPTEMISVTPRGNALEIFPDDSERDDAVPNLGQSAQMLDMNPYRSGGYGHEEEDVVVSVRSSRGGGFRGVPSDVFDDSNDYGEMRTSRVGRSSGARFQF